MKNWKTTMMGIFGLLTIVAKVATTKMVGPEDFAAATTSIGLIFAKDNNVTGK